MYCLKDDLILLNNDTWKITPQLKTPCKRLHSMRKETLSKNFQVEFKIYF